MINEKIGPLLNGLDILRLRRIEWDMLLVIIEFRKSGLEFHIEEHWMEQSIEELVWGQICPQKELGGPGFNLWCR